MERKLYKAQNLLSVSGLAVIAFGCWSIVKTVLTLILFSDLLMEGMDSIPGIDPQTIRIFMWVIVSVIMLISLAIRCFVGLSARAAGQGKKKSAAYLVFTVILILLSIASLIATVVNPQDSGILDLLITVLVELTSLLSLFEVLVNGIQVKKLTKELSGAEENGSVPTNMERA
ncbi:MAG: hypothetical protein IKF90_25285 [Parasporobacterium sp.]|nr:hypothetical protein [Parasporobacterium sp.]